MSNKVVLTGYIMTIYLYYVLIYFVNRGGNKYNLKSIFNTLFSVKIMVVN